MYSKTCFAVFLLQICSAVLGVEQPTHTTVTSLEEEIHGLELMAKFQEWVKTHSKVYQTHQDFSQRLKIWLHNNAMIQEHNNRKKSTSLVLGHNAFSDMTQDEFHQYFKLGVHAAPPLFKSDKSEMEARRTFESMAPLTLPDYINWVQMGAVTPVKNQGACGSCWAFSTTGALEGAKFIKTGELVALSEQNLLDCDHTDLGCNGGLMDNAFKFDEKSGGLCSETDYPYQEQQGDTCWTNCTDVPGSIVKTFIDVPKGDEKALLAAVAMQPVSVAIEASNFAFQFYKSGVIADDSCGANGNVDHGVLAVGYGTELESQAPYFLVKNSWGAEWGASGFVKIGRGGKNEFGVCSILTMASFPVTEL